MTVTTVFHCSDLHFGHPAVPEQYEAIEALIQERKYDVVAISGDVSQRSRAGEFQRAREFIKKAEAASRTIVVPGNHDVAWWLSPLGFGDTKAMFARYRAYISNDLEPVLRIAGATLVGLNTSQGWSMDTLTWNVRDISILGHLSRAQIEHARAEFEQSRTADARIIVMHHNPVKGELSQRHGLKNTQRILGAFATMGVDLVLCGHDHDYERSYPVRGCNHHKGTDIATGHPVDTLQPKPVMSAISAGASTFDTSQGTIHLILGGGGTSAPLDVYGVDAGTGLPQARIFTRPNRPVPGTTAGTFVRASADAVEDAIWSAQRDTGTGYGIAVFDHDPGHAGGETTITMNYYHAPGADQTPTANYELFETIELKKKRKR